MATGAPRELLGWRLRRPAASTVAAVGMGCDRGRCRRVLVGGHGGGWGICLTIVLVEDSSLVASQELRHYRHHHGLR